MCQEQQQIMIDLIFDFKDQKCRIHLEKNMKSCSLKKNSEKMLKVIC